MKMRRDEAIETKLKEILRHHGDCPMKMRRDEEGWMSHKVKTTRYAESLSQAG